MNNQAIKQQMRTALQWYAEQGVDICLSDTAINRFSAPPEKEQGSAESSSITQQAHRQINAAAEPSYVVMGKSKACSEAIRLAKQAGSLEELSAIIADFDGIAIKKTAGNMVFGAGNPKADIMIIAESPGDDEDRVGAPFAGSAGQLLDKALSCIGLDRTQEEPERAVYLTNILNWRPPGNRTSSSAEIEISLPFIERHIQLVKPKILVLCGGGAAKALLGKEQSISRLRKIWHDYCLQTKALQEEETAIPALATYHPSDLLKTPLQKKLFWADLLTLKLRHCTNRKKKEL